MIVEFIGSTGAGKTTFFRQVQRDLATQVEAAASFDLVAERIGVHGVTSSSVKNLISEVVVLPYFLVSLPRHREFLAFTLRILARQSKISFFMLNNLRSLERKVGMYEIIKRADPQRVILVDEGTLLSAHNLFVFTEAIYRDEEIARFASLAPLPDKVIYLRVPREVLVQRTLQRKDAPREMRALRRAQVEQYVLRAINLFEQLVENENIQRRTLIVEHQDVVDFGIESAIARVIDFILDREEIHLQIQPSHQLL